MLLLSLEGYAKDLTSVFEKSYQKRTRLSEDGLSLLKQHDVVLVPGVLAEILIWKGQKASFDSSYLASDYFGSQFQYFKGLGVNVQRLPTSTKSVKQTQRNIADVLDEAKMNGRKVFFLTHSLGGLALLDYLLDHPDDQKHVLGIVFLQVPFEGTPITQFFLKNPLKTILAPVLPLFNFTQETIRYLSPKARIAAMKKNEKALRHLIQTVPMLTVSGVVNEVKTIFRPLVEIMEFGCPVNAFERCLSPVVYPGPYDLSDGMVPLRSSQLEGVDGIILKGVDHGEAVVNVPFINYQRGPMTEAIMNAFFSR